MLEGICISLGMPNSYLRALPCVSEVLSALSRRAVNLTCSPAADLNVRCDGVPLVDLLPSLPKQFVASSSQPSLLINEGDLLPPVDAAAGAACELGGGRALGSALWQGSSCMHSSLHPFLHNIARAAVSYAHEPPCAAVLGACSRQRMHHSSSVRGGLQLNTFIGVFFLPCTSGDGSSMQSWHGYVSSRSAPPGPSSAAPRCSALVAFVSAVPEMGVLTLAALPQAAEAIP